MVDTINPNTSQPDSWGDSSAQPTPPASTPEDRFFGGFNQPGDTKINLAGGQPSEQTPAPVEEPQTPIRPQPVVEQPQVQPMPQAVSDVAAPIQPAEVKHTTYTNTSDMINWRGILVIMGIGLVSTVVVGLGLYFGLGAMNGSKLKAQQDQLISLESQLSALKTSPSPLELPVTETTTPGETTPVETPVVTPVTTPTETPVTTPGGSNPSPVDGDGLA